MVKAEPFAATSFESRTLELCGELAPCLLSDFVATALKRGFLGSRLVVALRQLLDRGFVTIDLNERVHLSAAGLAALGCAPEPTMEEILASIRRIISEEETASPAPSTASRAEPEEESLELVEGEADDKIINDIARVLSGGAAEPAEAGEEDILDLTAELGGLEPVGEDEALPLTAAEPDADAVFEADEPVVDLEAVALELVEPEPAKAQAEPEAEAQAGFMPSAPEPAIPPKPLSASEEAASALERAIAALRAGQVPASRSVPSIDPPHKAEPGPHVEGPPKVRIEVSARYLSHDYAADAHTLSASFCEETMPRKGRTDRTPLLLDLDASVFAPFEAAAGSEILVQVYLHHPRDRRKVRDLAKKADPEEAESRGAVGLGSVASQQALQVVLEGGGLEVRDAPQTVLWKGKIEVCQFTVAVPAGSQGKKFHLAVLVLASSVTLGKLKFVVRAAQASSELAPGDGIFHRYRYAFLSYAWADRPEVLRGAQLLRGVGVDFFNDVLSLKPGERWEKRLFKEIDRADVFFLFWSSNAKASPWIEKEIAYALDRQKTRDRDSIDIRPIILEGPPPPEPPACLKHIHFDDYLMHVIASAQRSRMQAVSPAEIVS